MAVVEGKRRKERRRMNALKAVDEDEKDACMICPFYLLLTILLLQTGIPSIHF